MIHLIRHGQAGPRHAYDTLSDLGRQQAAALGSRLAQQRRRYDLVLSGTLERQRLTAELALAAGFNSDAPAVRAEPLWDEFDLDHVFREIAPPLAADDAGFARELSALEDAMADETSSVHRNHTPCDIAVIRAWVQGRYAFSGESWTDFRRRINAGLRQLEAEVAGRSAIVFTSATPIGVAAAETLGLDDVRLWRLAGAAYNSSVTTLELRPDGWRLIAFNALPHLPDPQTWTLR